MTNCELLMGLAGRWFREFAAGENGCIEVDEGGLVGGRIGGVWRV